MIHKKFEDFPIDECEDFVEVLGRWHQAPGDYIVSAVEKNPPVTGGQIEIEVTIRRKSTGAQMQFRGGHVSNWVVDFEHALRRKVFG